MKSELSVFAGLGRLVCAAFVAAVLGVGGAAAEPNLPISIRTIIETPALLLQNNPTGGARLVSQTRDVVLADHSTLQSILNLLARADKDQKAAIGAGLGQAARLIVRTDQTFANEIQRALTETKDQEAMVAYTSAVGDQAIASVGSGGSAGAIGGQTNPLQHGPISTGPAQAISGSSVAVAPFTYNSSVSSTAASTPVSP